MSWWPWRGCAEVVVNISEATACQHITHHEIVISTQTSYTVNKRSSPSFMAIVRNAGVEFSVRLVTDSPYQVRAGSFSTGTLECCRSRHVKPDAFAKLKCWK